MPKKIPMLLVREREIPEPAKPGPKLLVENVLVALREATEIRPWLRLGPYTVERSNSALYATKRRLTEQLTKRVGKGKFDIKVREAYLFVRLLGSN